MSGAAVSNIVLGIVVVGWLISRQLRTRPVREDSAVRLVLVLGAIGVVELVESADLTSRRPAPATGRRVCWT